MSNFQHMKRFKKDNDNTQQSTQPIVVVLQRINVYLSHANTEHQQNNQPLVKTALFFQLFENK